MTTQLEQIWSQLLNFSTQYVVPDWGSLVGLIPILLAILMFLFITWTIYRFATAGPKRRGKRRMEPVPPPGHPHAGRRRSRRCSRRSGASCSCSAS